MDSIAVLHDIADPAAITSGSNTSGPPGQLVTLTGTSFDPVHENNTVFFGETQTTVEAATSTELTVKVPAGATSSLISVQTDNRVAYTPNCFEINFTGAPGSIAASSFDSGVAHATGLALIQTVLGLHTQTISEYKRNGKLPAFRLTGERSGFAERVC